MKLMVCFDSSAAANHALYAAKKRALLLGAKVYLVTSSPGGKEASTDDYEKVEKILEKIRSAISAEHISCETLLSASVLTPGENLSRIAEEKEMDEVYIGIKRRSKVGKLLFGSTAQYVILNAPCPVVTVK